RQGKAALVRMSELLHDHDRVEEVAARAAVLVREPRAQKALAPGAVPRGAIDHAVALPALLVGLDLALHELAERAAKQVVILGEQGALHRSSLAQIARRRPQSGA